MSDEEPTVDVRGLDREVNANDLLEAAQKVAEQPVGEGSAQSGDVVVADDSCHDDDCRVIVIGESHSGLFKPKELIDMTEDVIGTQQLLIEYVKNIENIYWRSNTFQPAIETPLHHEEGIAISYSPHISGSEMEALIDDDGVSVGTVKAYNDTVYVHLRDERDN
jgi:hypothetical protein